MDPNAIAGAEASGARRGRTTMSGPSARYGLILATRRSWGELVGVS